MFILNAKRPKRGFVIVAIYSIGRDTHHPTHTGRCVHVEAVAEFVVDGVVMDDDCLALRLRTVPDFFVIGGVGVVDAGAGVEG